MRVNGHYFVLMKISKALYVGYVQVHWMTMFPSAESTTSFGRAMCYSRVAKYRILGWRMLQEYNGYTSEVNTPVIKEEYPVWSQRDTQVSSR